jgi:FkbM family methyltransferase
VPKPPAVWQRPAYLPPETSLGSTEIIDVMLRHTPGRNLVIQAGAHVGLWPAVLSQHFNHVLSFEPVPALCAASTEAAPYPNVTISPHALSRECGIVRVSSPSGEKMARFSGSSAVADHGTEVMALSIDSLALTPDAIMLDIEGHELPALEGAIETIKRCRPTIVVEENEKSLRHRALGEMGAFMHPLGYVQVARFRYDFVWRPE